MYTYCMWYTTPWINTDTTIRMYHMCLDDEAIQTIPSIRHRHVKSFTKAYELLTMTVSTSSFSTHTHTIPCMYRWWLGYAHHTRYISHKRSDQSYTTTDSSPHWRKTCITAYEFTRDALLRYWVEEHRRLGYALRIDVHVKHTPRDQSYTTTDSSPHWTKTCIRVYEFTRDA